MPETAVQALDRTIACLRDTEPVIHAYAHVDVNRARAEAEAVDAAGQDARGALFGFPFGVKEVIEVAGMPAGCGSRALADRVSRQDAEVVRRLRRAGAVLVGTHVTHELTCGLDEPPTRNPWALDRYPGGSSAGGGASVAVGSARVALGTDAAGSVRIPAAMTGVVGLKPTAGRLPHDGVVRYATAPSIDHIGVLARTVLDVERVLCAMVRPVPKAHASSERHADSVGAAPLDGFRLARLGQATEAALADIAELDSDVEAVVTTAYQQLLDLGAELVTIEVPELALAVMATSTVFAAELGAANHELLAQCPEAFHHGVRELLQRGLATSVEHLVRANRVRDALSRALDAAFATERLDALVTPTTPRAAMPLASFDPAVELGTLIPYTCPFNLTGRPAISVPCGFTPDGLPVGMQLAGRMLDEDVLLRISGAYEQSTPWHLQHPRVSSTTSASDVRSTACA